MVDQRTVIRGGTVAVGDGTAMQTDLALRRGRIESVGDVPPESGDTVVDAAGRLVMPGFIDAHSHADAAVFQPDVQRALLRQGVTTVIAGQDGVSYAPGDGAYATDYFSSINGSHPTYRGGGVGELLSTYDGTTPLNVGYLIPAGTVREAVRGLEPGPASPAELAQMRELVRVGMKEGALGLSSGLDYIPNRYADTEELIDLCRPVVQAGGLYVTHMRGGYENQSKVGIDEVSAIALATGVRVHVSHYHGPSSLLLELMDGMTLQGVDASFDVYPYRRGCTLLSILGLPPYLLTWPRAAGVARLTEPAVRSHLLTEWFPSLDQHPRRGPGWPDNITFAHVGSTAYNWVEGLTVREASLRAGVAPGDLVLDVLVAAAFDVTVVVAVLDQRPYADLSRLITDSRQVAGSDGIYVGTHPHPRGWGTFAKFLRLARERGDFSWATAAVHLSSRSASRFGLAARGFIREGFVADIILVDPNMVSDLAIYSSPRSEAIGIEDVFVKGVAVLTDGEPTGHLPGAGIRAQGTAKTKVSRK